jgi:integrase
MASIEKRPQEDGSIAYRVKVRLKGHPVESATFERLTDAKKWAQSTEAAIRENRYFKTSQSRKHTLTDAVERYRREVLKLSPKKNDTNQRHYLKWWQERIGDYTLAHITPALIIEHRNALIGHKNAYGREIGANTANKYAIALSHLFSVAMNEWEWVEYNPLRKVKKLAIDRGRVRFLDDAERKRLLVSCKASNNSHLYAVVVLALSTGARKNEILSLKWQDVDFKRQAIVLHETKNGERRVLPLQGHAHEILLTHSKIRSLHNEFVFPSDKKGKPIDIRTAWENVVKEAELEDFRFHDLRHSAASYLAMNGASLAEIAEVLGHKTLQMVKRYAHLSEAHTSVVVAKMNKRIFG